MTNDLPPRSDRAVRTRLLSVIGVGVVAAVVGSLLLWHAQVGEMLGLAADKAPVVSSVSAPANGMPPVTLATTTPSHRPTHRPTKNPSGTPTTPSKQPTKKPGHDKTTGPVSREESIDALSPKLRARLIKAFAAAKAAGVPIRINSGRRSAAKQQRLLNEAIKKYGSYQAAIHWVLPPKDSAHVQGKAVDIAPAAAMAWLNKNGWKYGVCRRYDNEPWHFEALTAPGTKCPPREPSATAQAD
ncbi:M15 family metallopeptidase [Kribbella sp. NPDC026611]|uniref:M15 family metallopeptidase n=1 Tax=Kribbella sp. NPDC026611 TaxID=3154911 RepID=UPI0033F366EB